jgi:hypothetical protein
MDRLTPLTNFKTIHPHFVVDNENIGTFGQTQQFVYSLSSQQHVSMQQTIIRLARMEDTYTVYLSFIVASLMIAHGTRTVLS